MFLPTTLTRADRFCRLLPPNGEELDFAALRALGLSMRSDRTRIPFARMSPPPPAGYTYAGQFILHDLMRDDTPLSCVAQPTVRETINLSQPALNLGSLYGGGPFSEDRHLYAGDKASLKVGTVRTRNGVCFDLPLDPVTLRPWLADSRNSENVILRQVHGMFLQFHNRAVEQLRGEVVPDNLFEEATRLVRWQFQWLVRYDYLPKLCNPFVYQDIVIEGNRQIDWPVGKFSIPVEVAHAAARFGHGMVRPKYDLNRQNIDFGLSRIIGEVRKPGALDPSLAIDWRHFLTTRAPANNIDTAIPAAMYDLPVEAVRRFGAKISEDNPADLPIRTLYRGASLELPTGEQARTALCPAAKIHDRVEGFPNYKPFQALVDLGFEGRTPLWYYILLEAEVNERGANLGELGSRLLCEVIEGALEADPASIVWELKRDPKWRPPQWETSTGKMARIDSFLDLAVAIGLVDAPWV